MKNLLVVLLFIACCLSGYVASAVSGPIGSPTVVGTYQAACAMTAPNTGECVVIDTRTGRIISQYYSKVFGEGFRRSTTQEVP
jgi:hypothetical protein